MSHRPTSDIVKFVANFGETQFGLNIQTKLCEPDSYQDYLEESLYPREDEDEDIQNNVEAKPFTEDREERGWAHKGYEQTGKRKRITAEKWVKENFVVYCFNASQYNCVGEVCALVTANDKASIEEFLKDFKDQEPTDYEETESVEQWS